MIPLPCDCSHLTGRAAKRRRIVALDRLPTQSRTLLEAFMFGSPYSLRIALVTIAIMAPALGAQSRSPLHGALASGPHGVGFMKRELRDPVRLDLPKLDAAGRPQSADRSRRMTVHVWYPTAQTGGRTMTFRDYMFSHHADTATEAHRRSDEANRRRFFGQFGTVTDTGWQRLLATPLHGRRDAAPPAGRFPLVIGMLRTLSTTVTNEYLASHGFVVAMIDAFQPDNPD